MSNVPEGANRKKVWKFVNSNQFDVFIMGTIILNIVQMACNYQGEPVWYTELNSFINYIFTLVFLVEAALKIIAYGWAYFGTTWNKFDFFVVCASLLDIVMDQMDPDTLGTIAVAP